MQYSKDTFSSCCLCLLVFTAHFSSLDSAPSWLRFWGLLPSFLSLWGSLVPVSFVGCLEHQWLLIYSNSDSLGTWSSTQPLSPTSILKGSLSPSFWFLLLMPASLLQLLTSEHISCCPWPGTNRVIVPSNCWTSWCCLDYPKDEYEWSCYWVWKTLSPWWKKWITTKVTEFWTECDNLISSPLES